MTGTRHASEKYFNDPEDRTNGTWKTHGNQRLLVFDGLQDNMTSAIQPDALICSRDFRNNDTTRMSRNSQRDNFTDESFLVPYMLPQQTFHVLADSTPQCNDVRFDNLQHYPIHYYSPIDIQTNDPQTTALNIHPTELSLIRDTQGNIIPPGINLFNAHAGFMESRGIRSTHSGQIVTNRDPYEACSIAANDELTGPMFTLKDIPELIDNLQIAPYWHWYTVVGRFPRISHSWYSGKRRSHRFLMKHKIHSPYLCKRCYRLRRHVEISNGNKQCSNKYPRRLTFTEKSIERARITRLKPFVLH